MCAFEDREMLLVAADHEQRRREQFQIWSVKPTLFVGCSERVSHRGPAPCGKRFAPRLELIGDLHGVTLLFSRPESEGGIPVASARPWFQGLTGLNTAPQGVQKAKNPLSKRAFRV